MGLFETSDIGIDLGTSSILVYVKHQGIVLREPSIVAVERQTGRLTAIGEEARAMLGRTPPGIAVVRPLQDGVISNFDVTARMLRHFFKKVVGTRRLLRAIAAGEVSEAYLAMDADLFIARQVREACEKAGVRLVEASSMKALGQACGVEVKTASAGIRK